MHNLPRQTTSFVGRSDELAEIAKLLADPSCSLLTVLGAGGIGKTRLALQAAEQQLPRFNDGVYFVPLTPVGSPDLIAPAIIAALQIPLSSAEEPAVQIVRILRDQHMLLVIDNFEHLLAGSDLLSEILQAARDVKFIVTSRERLNLKEEWALGLEGLSIPDTHASKPLENYSAVELFVQRARQVQASFSLPDNTEAITTICQQVEGMPLGLELAASWLRAMSCQQIATQMSNLDFLTTPLRNIPERHRSLRAAFEQSWRLLSADEQNVLMQLSVFRGGFDLEAAEQVTGATLSLLASLTDKSLIRYHPSGRYDLQELLRQYTADKLTADKARATANHHLDYFLKLAEQSSAHLFGSEQRVWFDRLEINLDNLRAALAWAEESGAAEMGLKLVTTLREFWEYHNYPQEGFHWAERLLALTPDAPLSLRAQALQRAAELAKIGGFPERGWTLSDEALTLARQTNDPGMIAWALATVGSGTINGDNPILLDESIALFRQFGDRYGLSHALRRRAWAANDLKDYGYAQPLLEESLVYAREVGDTSAAAWSLMLLGWALLAQNYELKRTGAIFEESVSLFRELKDQRGAQMPLVCLGRVEQLMGHDARAQAAYAEALAMKVETEDYSYALPLNLVGVGILMDTQGEPESAARLLAASRFEPWMECPFLSNAAFDAQVTSVCTQLGEIAFAAIWETARTMTDEQAVRYALEQLLPPEKTRPSSPRETQPLFEPLSVRELEVLHLIADGMSNREIAHKLFISVATVKEHNGNIYGKLGVSNRTQAVTQAQKLSLL